MAKQFTNTSDSELPPSLQRHIIRGEQQALDIPRTRPDDPARRDRDLSLPPLPRSVPPPVSSIPGPSSYAPSGPAIYLPPPAAPFPTAPLPALGGPLPPPHALAPLSFGTTPSGPIHSDPIYHTSRTQQIPQSMVRSASRDTPPLVLRPPRGEPYSSWPEVEAGPSSRPYVSYRGPPDNTSDQRLHRITSSPPPTVRHGQMPMQGSLNQLPILEVPRARRPYELPHVPPDPPVMMPSTSTQAWVSPHLAGTSPGQRYETPPQQAFTHTFALSLNMPPSAPHSDSGHSSSRTPDIGGEIEGSRDRTSTARNPRGPRKTEVACNFCRGRKLRCDGGRPSCYNCTSRNKPCEYEAQPRRRGPGRAPKGSRARRRDPDTRASSSQVEDSPSPYAPVSETTQQPSEYDEDEDDGELSDKGGTGGKPG